MQAPYTRILIVALVLTLTVIHSGALLKGIPFYGTPRRSPRCSWQPVVQDALKEMRTSAVNRYEEAVHVLAFVLVYLGLAVAFIGLVRTCLWVCRFLAALRVLVVRGCGSGVFLGYPVLDSGRGW